MRAKRVVVKWILPALSLAKTDLDAEVLPDEGEEGGGEVNPPLPVQWHVHPDKLLVGQPGDNNGRKRLGDQNIFSKYG